MALAVAFGLLAKTMALASEPVAVPPEVEKILSAPAGDSDYPKQDRCLPLHRIRSVTVLDQRHIAFKLNRKQLYLIQFEHRCPGIRRNNPVAYETVSGSSLCALDAIRGIQQYGFGDRRLGPPCSIPGFEPITEEQLRALKEALRHQRKK